MKHCLLLALAGCLAATGWTADLVISEFDRQGNLTWTNALSSGVNTIQTAPDVAGPWTNTRNYFTTSSVDQVQVSVTETQKYIRLLSVDVSGTPEGHQNMIESYGIIETLAGSGEDGGDKVDFWEPEFEGGPATNAELSRPHITWAGPDNNLYLVDEGSSLVLLITTNGLIYPYAGTPNQRGDNGDGPAPATSLSLNWPNGGYMLEDGTFYVLDTFNGKIRRIDTNGVMETVFTTAAGISRALWVTEDESAVYFGSVGELRKWTEEEGEEVVQDGFTDMGNIIGDDRTGIIYITDRDENLVHQLTPDGTLTTIAGNGDTVGGGDGFPALATGLNQPRTVALFPNGGYLIGEHRPGYRIWYVDPAGIIHLWMQGGDGINTGDGAWFYDSLATPKVGKVRALTLDRSDNIIMTVTDEGFVRRINFQRLVP